jgi:LL-diaminopimelate aminotransferase
MATANKNFKELQRGYLFGEIAKRTKDFIEKNPGVEVMKLGVGDTTEPLSRTVVKGLIDGAKKLANVKTYTGYQDAEGKEGNIKLLNAILDFYKAKKISFNIDEIFVNDGAKTDLANIQSIFALDNVVAISDPVYPAYLDATVISGRTGKFVNGKYEKLVYLECNEKNGFVPFPPKQKVDIIYLCNPNNPTGSVASRKQLKAFVDYAIKNKAVIIYDAAYVEYISDKSLPKSIYEIPGAKKCAIEINSFSKWSGFTGVRLGWTVVPMDLVIEQTKKGEVNNLWSRRQGTMFNGASNVAQAGALAALSPAGQRESKKMVGYYMNNARIIKRNLLALGFKVFGGEHAPYIWVKNPNNLTSWEFFDKLLNETHVVGTPGSGFGRSGEGYLRLSAFGHTEDIEKAVKSIRKNFKF